MDCSGVCLVADVSTSCYNFHRNVGQEASSNLIFLFIIGESSYIHKLDDEWSRCRWSTLSGEPMLYVKSRGKQLNIIDTVKQQLILKDFVTLDKSTLEIYKNYTAVRIFLVNLANHYINPPQLIHPYLFSIFLLNNFQ